MGLIAFEELQPGMVLAEDLLNDRGQFVLAKGVKLEGYHLQALGRWKVSEVNIEDGDEADAGSIEISQECRERSESFARDRFKLNDLSHEVIDAVFQHSVQINARRFQQGWQPPTIKPVEMPPLPADARKPSSDDLVRGKVSLASLPDVYQKIVAALNTPGSSAMHLANIVSKDSSISLKLLKLVNSAYYGLPTKVESISRAITLLGTRELMSLALGITIVRMFRNIPTKLIDMEVFWRHSIRCALFTQLLAKKVGGVEDEHFFVGGLLHDIGRLVMLVEIPEWYARPMCLMLDEEMTMVQAEKLELGYDHGLVGRKLCELWRLSRVQSQMVGWHHKPQGDDFSRETCILHLADFLAHSFGQESDLTLHVPTLQPKAWEVTGLPVEVIPTMTNQVDRLYNDIIGTFLAD